MTDLEISKALALAIGHNPYYVTELLVTNKLAVFDHASRSWRIFDYRDWNVIGPIAQRYGMFPIKEHDYDGYFKCWVVYWFSSHSHNNMKIEANTPQSAIALAVIGANK